MGAGLKTEQISVLVSFDTSDLQGQIAQLLALLEATPADSRQHALELVSGYLDRLGSDVVIGENVRTAEADGTVNFLYSVLLDTEFERLLAAISGLGGRYEH